MLLGLLRLKWRCCDVRLITFGTTYVHEALFSPGPKDCTWRKVKSETSPAFGTRVSVTLETGMELSLSNLHRGLELLISAVASTGLIVVRASVLGHMLQILISAIIAGM